MKKIFSTIISVGFLLLSNSANASFQLETMTVILDADEGRKVFNVKNTGNEPMLLSTKVSDLPESEPMAKNIIISPPIIRIEPQESQQINFLLKKGVSISDEAILKVSFQGVGESKSNTTKMPIRQDVAMLIVPAGMTLSQTPWDNLSVVQKNEQLIFTNTGKQVIRLSPSITALPSKKTYSIGQFYITPGEKKIIDVSGNVADVMISPLSRYGFKTANDIKISVTH